MFKIEIETLWNQLIFQKYNSLVKIDETNLKKKLIKRKKNLKKKTAKYFRNSISAKFWKGNKQNNKRNPKKYQRCWV